MISSKVACLVLAFLLTLQIAVAQPHGKRHINRRDEVVYQTVVVYVDQYGNTLDPAQYNHPATSTTSATTPAAAVPTAQPTTSTLAAIVSSAPTASSVPVASTLNTSGSTDKSVSFSGLSKPGIAYNPYYDNGQCKTPADIDADLAKLTSFGVIRIYDLSCDQVKNVTTAAAARGMQVYIGVPNSQISNTAAAVAQIIKEVAGRWAAVYAISIGNELVTGNQMDAGTISGLVNQSRTTLRGAGYNGPVVTTEAWVTYIQSANSALCSCSDFIAANCHPFFDSNVPAAKSGQFVSESVGKIKGVCAGKDVIVTETGWPHQGTVFNQAVPGLAEQQVALQTIHDSMPSGVFYFSSFDAAWKVDNSGTYGTEKFWGIQFFSIFN